MLHRPSIFSVPTPPAPPGARIGLLGGSFNPAHEGHRQISDIARRRLDLDAVWWIVSPGNPLKDKRDLVPLALRLVEARRVAAVPWITVTAFETALGSAFTVDTLRFLSCRHSRTHFVWLMGADNLASLHRWRAWREIAAVFPMAVVDRPGWHLPALSSPAARALARNRVSDSAAATLPNLTAPAWTMLTGALTNLLLEAPDTAARTCPMKRLYDWMMRQAAGPRAPHALALVSFAESSFFPIPPDVMLIPMVLANRAKAWWYATLATISSVIGGLAGYAIGYFLFQTIGQPILKFYGHSGSLDTVKAWFTEWGVWILIAKGWTPFPYKVLTILSGVAEMALVPFLVASIVGLLYFYGEPIKAFIEKRLTLLTTLFLIALVGGFVSIKYLPLLFK
jgi:nicotinate (nicotinamide) nucleotide adenylyltransferase